MPEVTKYVGLMSDDGCSDAPVPKTPPPAALPSNKQSKLDQEPNPFEESFSGLTTLPRTSEKLSNGSYAVSTTSQAPLLGQPLPPPPPALNSIQQPATSTTLGTLDTLAQTQGLYAPVLVQAPPQTTVGLPLDHSQMAKLNYATVTRSTCALSEPSTSQNQGPQRKASADTAIPNGTSNTNDSTKQANKHTLAEDHSASARKKARSRERLSKDDEKRKNFLERNRLAALKCRQRKKQWLNDLQSRVEMLTRENEELKTQKDILQEEVVNLKTLLMAHKDCMVGKTGDFAANVVHTSLPQPASSLNGPSFPATSVAPSINHPMNNTMLQNTLAHSQGSTTASLPMESTTAAPMHMMTSNLYQHPSTMMHFGEPVTVTQRPLATGPGRAPGIFRF